MKNQSRRVVPILVSRLTLFVGLFNIFANTLRPFRNPARAVDAYFLVYLNSTAFATTVLTGITLLILSQGLKRKKRRAWNLTILILTINLVADLFRFHRHPFQILFSAILLTTLAFFKEDFYAKSDPKTRWQPAKAFFVLLIALILISFILLTFRHSASIVGNPSVIEIFETVLRGFIWVSGPIQYSEDKAADTVSFTLGTFGIFLLIVPLGIYLRRARKEEMLEENDSESIKVLLKKDTHSDSLSYFATRHDKEILWSSNKKAGLAFRIENGVLLVSGDPFGEYSLWPELISKAMAMSSEYAWVLAVIGCTHRAGELWIKNADMKAIDLGDEAIIEVKNFTLEGPSIKNVREMVNKVKRKGYETKSLKSNDLADSERAQLITLAREWRYGAPERGFSMALDRFLSTEDPDCVITIAIQDQKIKAFLSFVPWGDKSLSVDRMQRDIEVESGINELLIVASVEYARQNDLNLISLNFAVFKSIFERADKINVGLVLRVKRKFLRWMSHWFQVESLFRFNAKFQPVWQTRYVLVPKLSNLASVSIAALKAEKFIGSVRRHGIS